MIVRSNFLALAIAASAFACSGNDSSGGGAGQGGTPSAGGSSGAAGAGMSAGAAGSSEAGGGGGSVGSGGATTGGSAGTGGSANTTDAGPGCTVNNPNACDTCVFAHCCMEYTACFDDTDCFTALGNLADCVANADPADGTASCYDDYAGTNDAAQGLNTCAQASCKAACATSSP